MTTKIIICLDGCGPEYIARSETPNLDALAREGFSTIGKAIPIIKDRYIVHHQNLGGAAYVYLNDLSTMNETIEILKEEKGIEAVLTNMDAARRYNLHPKRIGHLFVLADADTVFGALPTAREEVNIRSHGSLHEREIPIYAYGAGRISS